MASQSDRYSDGYEIANASQNVASNSASDRGQRTEVSDRGQNVLLYSPQHHVVQVGNASSVAPSPGTTPDVMMPEIDLDSEVPCMAFGCHDDPKPADLIVAFTYPAFVEEWGPESWAICDPCFQSGERLAAEMGITAWRIVQVLR